jgi:hypothetical protein
MALPGLFSGLRDLVLGGSKSHGFQLHSTSGRQNRGLRIEPLECRTLLSATVGDATINVSGTPTGTNETYVAGNVITVEWNSSNLPAGETVDSCTVTFNGLADGLEPNTILDATDDNGDGIWTVQYTVQDDGTTDTADCYVSVVVNTTNALGFESVFPGSDEPTIRIDDYAPFMQAAGISIEGTPSGPTADFLAGDTVTVSYDAWDDNNLDLISVKADLSAFGGGTDVEMTDTDNDGIFTVNYTIPSGSIDAIGLGVTVKVVDDAGYTAQESSVETISIDSASPALTSANLSLTGGTEAGFTTGDVITIKWNAPVETGDNSDVDSVTADLSQFGEAVDADLVKNELDGTFSLTFTATKDVAAVDVRILVTATDDAGNVTTATYTEGPTVTAEHIGLSSSSTSTISVVGDTLTATWNNSAAGDNNTGVIKSVTVDFSQFGGNSAVAATYDNATGIYTATYVITTGTIDNAGATISVSVTDGDDRTTKVESNTSLAVDNESPSVTKDNITVSEGKGTNKAYIVGDVITVQWDASADGNNDIQSVTFAIGYADKSIQLTATYDDVHDLWTASTTLAEGSDDVTGLTVTLKAVDDAGNSTQVVKSIGTAVVDNQSPVVTSGSINITSIGSGVDGTFVSSDTLTVTWTEGSSNADISGVTFDFTAFGGGVTAGVRSNGVWSASYTIAGGSLVGNYGIHVIATDDAGNVSSGDSSQVAVNTVTPTVTAANISVTTSATGSISVPGDVITATWNNTSSGDANGGIASVTVDFSAFGGGIVAATETAGVWTATYTITSGTVDASNLGVAVNVTNTARNKTVVSKGSFTVDNESPVVTDGAIAITSVGTGSSEAFIVGNMVVVQWNNSSSGDANDDVVSVTVDFSEFGGGIATATKTGDIWQASYLITASTSLDSAAANVKITVVDDAGNTVTVADTTNAVVDAIVPVVSSINRTGATNSASATLTFLVTFSEDVTGVNSGAFELVTTGTASGTISSVVGSENNNSVYLVTVSNVSGDGTIGLNLIDKNRITDYLGNTLGGLLLNDGDFTGQTYKVLDVTMPIVSSIVPSASPTNADTITFTITFSEAVAGVDLNDFMLAKTGTATGTLSSISGSGSTYTITVTDVLGEGALGVNLVDDDSVTDVSANPLGGLGQLNGSFAGTICTIDNTAPTVTSITRGNDSPTNADKLTFVVTFSEAVAGLTTNNFQLVLGTGVDGTIQKVTGSGTTWTVTITNISGNGSLGLNLSDAVGIADLAGNAMTTTFSGGESYLIDTTNPTGTIGLAAGSSLNSETITFMVMFDEALSSLTPNHFTLATTGTLTATVSSVTGSNGQYLVTVSASGEGTLTVTLVANDVTDVAGNYLVSNLVSDTYTVDTVHPSAAFSLGVATPTSADSVAFTVTFGEDVVGLDLSDFALVTTGTAVGTISGITGSGSSYVVTVSGVAGDGTLALKLLDNGTVVDHLMNAAVTVTSSPYTIDNTGPTATISLVDDSTTNADTVRFLVTLNESVSGLDANDFALTFGGTAAGTIASVTGSGTSYTVTLTNVSGDGEIRLQLKNDGTVSDAASNVLAAGVTSSAYTIDNTSPTVTIAPVSTHVTAGEAAEFTVTFSEDVTGFNVNDLVLDGNVSGTLVASITGSGSTYTVKVIGMEGSGTVTLGVDAGVAQDSAENANTAATTATTNYGGTTIGLYNKANTTVYLKNTNAGGKADTKYEVTAKSDWITFSGDWDGNGTVTVGLYDPKASTFYLLDDDGTVFVSFMYGAANAGWKPIAGDWNGDGVDTVGLYDAKASTFYLKNSHTGGKADSKFWYGVPGKSWTAIAGDWNGDGVDTVGLYDAKTSTFYLKNSLGGGKADSKFVYGAANKGWTAVSGDWDGNGVQTVGLYDAKTGTFYLKNSLEGGKADSKFVYGVANKGWTPITGTWNASSSVLTTTDNKTGSATTTAITADDVTAIKAEAIKRWQAAGDLSSSQLAAINAATVVVTDFADGTLAAASDGVIYLDSDAAGFGWYVDATPSSDSEYTSNGTGKALTAGSSSAAVDKIDLLTVVEEELGKIAGLDELTDCVAEGEISASVRSSLLAAV